MQHFALELAVYVSAIHVCRQSRGFQKTVDVVPRKCIKLGVCETKLGNTLRYIHGINERWVGWNNSLKLKKNSLNWNGTVEAVKNRTADN